MPNDWSNLLLYAFPLIALIPQVIRRIREQKHRVLSVALLWRNQHWFAELPRLLTAAPWPIPLRRDLLSQAIQNEHIVDIVLPARAVGTGSLPFHAQGLCSSYSSLTRSYRWTISRQEQPGCSFLEGVLEAQSPPPCHQGLICAGTSQIRIWHLRNLIRHLILLDPLLTHQ